MSQFGTTLCYRDCLIVDMVSDDGFCCLAVGPVCAHGSRATGMRGASPMTCLILVELYIHEIILIFHCEGAQDADIHRNAWQECVNATGHTRTRKYTHERHRTFDAK